MAGIVAIGIDGTNSKYTFGYYSKCRFRITVYLLAL